MVLSSLSEDKLLTVCKEVNIRNYYSVFSSFAMFLLQYFVFYEIIFVRDVAKCLGKFKRKHGGK